MLAAEAREAARKARELTRRKNSLEGNSLPGKLVRLPQQIERRHRAVPGRRRFGRRIGQAGPRFEHPGDPAAVRQDPQRREGQPRQDARPRGNPHDHQRAGLRYPRGVRPRKAPLRQDHHHDRRRRGRLHIRTLLLTFFFRHMQELIKAGRVYVAQPPLYQVTRKKKSEYVLNERDATDADRPGPGGHAAGRFATTTPARNRAGSPAKSCSASSSCSRSWKSWSRSSSAAASTSPSSSPARSTRPAAAVSRRRRRRGEVLPLRRATAMSSCASRSSGSRTKT